ncbi:MAG: hypothetical protein HZA64_13615 [Rhodocyclales bacterium]|nr:hypothetical protein [Rhodocyclales bacterium]
MMNEEMMRRMQSMQGGMMSHPMAQGAMMAATGFAAGKGLLGTFNPFNPFKNPLLLLAGGIAAGYLLHRYEKEIVAAVSKATGMGKDFALQQKENLEDLVAEAQDKEAKAATPKP